MFEPDHLLLSDHVLTTRPVRDAVMRFGLEMYPPEVNVVMAVPGAEIALAHRGDVDWEAWPLHLSSIKLG